MALMYFLSLSPTMIIPGHVSLCQYLNLSAVDSVYSLSDPRAQILKSFVERLSAEKDRTDEFELYCMVERLAPEIISGKAKMYKGVSANVDFYSGFVYSMLNLPLELYTPIFAIARTVGWSAHRIEELANNGKIIRPAYLSIAENQKYVPLDNR